MACSWQCLVQAWLDVHATQGTAQVCTALTLAQHCSCMALLARTLKLVRAVPYGFHWQRQDCSC
jgi:hypothetical protein